MNVDDTVLMAYVDDELSPQERQQIEDELRAHAELADKVALFKASRLPYREAFAEQKLPPVPDSLVKRVDDLLRAHTEAAKRVTAPSPAAQDTNESVANDAVIGHSAQLPPSAPVRSRLRIAPAWLAVAFVGGAFCCGVVLRLAPGVGFNPGGNAPSNAATVASSTMGSLPWVQVAASYQQLYSRDTVSHMWPDVSDAQSTVDEIRTEDGIALRVPDLSKAGLRFIRVQRLKFHGRPLVQIVYLPQKGDPVALCVIKEDKADQSVASQRIDTMNVVTWRESKLGYALIGASSNGDLAPLGKEIAGRHFDPLFGSV
ncbi:anti-sigma factor [Paraburkholderia sp. Tr-20389]|uniref:anti-sigma factor family protein n=1 Tax=Paraburkholderia sp. Tr-20389 TaxID=2703903 RepID=UPI0019802CB1|nr:anti-sigma factor [Paraburkholderia sp. Tr-20389]MBN3751809.1 anti-sigma factor [Paraburkholderia sp. Tr-20389]